MGLLSSISNFAGDLFGADEIRGASASGREELYGYSREARADLQPWRQMGERQIPKLEGFIPTTTLAGLQSFDPFGTKSVQDLMSDPSQITKSPYYQFQLSQGLGSLERSKLAKGKFFSGETAQDILGFAEGLASSSYADEFNRRMSLANLENTDWNRRMGLYQAGYGRDLDTYNRMAGLAQLGQASATGQAGFSMTTGQGMNQSWQLQGQDVASANAAGMNALIQGGMVAGMGGFSGSGALYKPKV